ncbi:DUF2690 domain-containing protein [Streptomyces sp. NPDC020096]
MPRELPVECARLVAALRELKDRSRLNLVELAAVTAISKSSWERYLNGKQFPPRQAVQALCQAARETDGRILAQWEVADATWSRRGHTSSPRPAGTSTAPAGTGGAVSECSPFPQAVKLRRRVLVSASGLISARPRATAVGVFVLCAAMVTPAAVIYASRSPTGSFTVRAPVCQLRSCEGRNPRTTACEDPVTVASHTAADGTRLEIRDSPSCQAGWVRSWPGHSGFRIEITGPEGHPQAVAGTSQSADEELITTNMIAAPYPARLRACYYPSARQPGRDCFSGDS